MPDSPIRMTIGAMEDGRKVAVLTTGGHPQIPDSGDCQVLDIEVVDGWDETQINAWYDRSVLERKWETRQ